MAKMIFPDTAEGRAQANAVADPKHIIVNPGRNLVVLTEGDVPEAQKATDVVLSRLQLLDGALTVGGQVLWNAVKAFIEDQKVNGTPKQQNYWLTSTEFLRRETYIRQLRLAIKGAKTEQQSKAEMDNVFLAGSGYEPTMSAG